MKSLKYFWSLISVFLLTGCMYASIDIDIRNDDSGTVVYTLAYEEEYMNEQDVSPDLDEDIYKEIEGATVEDVEFEKDDNTYIGQEVTIPFESLEDFNVYMEKLMESDTETYMKATREGDEVTISLLADEESYEESKMFLNYIDYSLKIKVQGKVTSNNADEFNEKDNILIWDIETMLKKGVNLTYNTSTGSNEWVLYITGGLLLVITGLMVSLILRKRVNNKI